MAFQRHLLFLLLFQNVESTPKYDGMVVHPAEKPDNIFDLQLWHPYVVAFLKIDSNSTNSESSFCTGTLIRSNQVLGAAHCFFNKTKSFYDNLLFQTYCNDMTLVGCIKVSIGDPNFSTTYESGAGDAEHINVIDIRIHETYFDQSKRFFENDIAIITLERHVDINNYTNVAPLPTHNSTLTDSGVIMGWGYTSYEKYLNGTPRSKAINYGFVNILSSQTCQRNLTQDIGPLPESTICTIGNPSVGCFGDSGGPLICQTQNQSYLCGIFSGGDDCKPYIPAFYSSVTFHLDWIEETEYIAYTFPRLRVSENEWHFRAVAGGTNINLEEFLHNLMTYDRFVNGMIKTLQQVPFEEFTLEIKGTIDGNDVEYMFKVVKKLENHTCQSGQDFLYFNDPCLFTFASLIRNRPQKQVAVIFKKMAEDSLQIIHEKHEIEKIISSQSSYGTRLEIVENTDQPLKFDDYEYANVDTINQQLLIPFEFKKHGFWSSKKERYLFYALGLETMKQPLKRPPNLDLNILQTKNPLKIKERSKWLNLSWYVKISLVSSQTLRNIAKQAKEAIETKSLKETVGILGTLGLRLAPPDSPFGIALMGLKVGFAVASGPGAPLAPMIDQDELYYARIATNHLLMVNGQAKFMGEFIHKASDVFKETLIDMEPDEQEDLDQLIYANDILAMLYYAFGSDMPPKFKGLSSQKDLRNTIKRQINNDLLQEIHGYLSKSNTSSIEWAIALNKLKTVFINGKAGNVLERTEVYVQCLQSSSDPKQCEKEFPKIGQWGTGTMQIAKNLLPKSIKQSSLITQMTRTLRDLSSLFEEASQGTGIYETVIGVKEIKGSGSIVDLIFYQADIVKRIQLNILSIYQQLTHLQTSDLDLNAFLGADLMTGIQMFACNLAYSGTSSPLYVGIKHVNESFGYCQTKDLTQKDGIYSGYWHTFNGTLLGSCNTFKLEETFDLQLESKGTDALCLRYLTLSTDYEEVPRFHCDIHSGGVWIASDYNYDGKYIDYTDKLVTSCEYIPGISQINIYTGNFGSDTSLRFFVMFDGGLGCTTNTLDNPNINDFQFGSKNVFTANTLGTCYEKHFTMDDMLTDDFGKYLTVEIQNELHEIELAAIELFLNFERSAQRVVCDIGPHGFLLQFDERKTVKCYLKDRSHSFDPRAIHAIEVIAKEDDIGCLRFKLCTGDDLQKCCETSSMYGLTRDVPSKLEGILLCECENFFILNDTYEITPLRHHGYTVEAKQLFHSVAIYGTRFKDTAPMHTCDNFNAPCKIPNSFQVSGIDIGVCDYWYSGTDDSVSIQMRSNGIICDTGPLDKPGMDDLERSSWTTYRSHELGGCSDFAISTTDLKVVVSNADTDGLCIDKLQIYSGGRIPSRLYCYIEENGIWIDNGHVSLKCTFGGHVQDNDSKFL